MVIAVSKGGGRMTGQGDHNPVLWNFWLNAILDEVLRFRVPRVGIVRNKPHETIELGIGFLGCLEKCLDEAPVVPRRDGQDAGGIPAQTIFVKC